MGPFINDAVAIWERGGSTRLIRNAIDDGFLASYAITESLDNKDQLTRVENRLLFQIGRSIYSLALDAPSGTKPDRLKVETEVMSSSFVSPSPLFEANPSRCSTKIVSPKACAQTPSS